MLFMDEISVFDKACHGGTPKASEGPAKNVEVVWVVQGIRITGNERSIVHAVEALPRGQIGFGSVIKITRLKNPWGRMFVRHCVGQISFY